MPLLQTLSHVTRAFIWNSDGLPGFVAKFEIINVLKHADETGKLEQAKMWQVIDLDKIGDELTKLEDSQKYMVYLSEEYPSLYIFMLR